MVGSHALDGEAQDHAGLLVCLGFRLRFRIADDRGRFVSNLILQRGEQFILRFLGRHARDALKALRCFLLDLSDIALAAFDLALQRGNLMLPCVERLNATIERFFTLGDAVLSGAHLFHALLVLRFGFLLEFESLILCFEDRLFAHRLGLSFCVSNHVVGLLSSFLRRGVDYVAGDDEAESYADDCADDQPCNSGHMLPLPFLVSSSHDIKNPDNAGPKRNAYQKERHIGL